MSAESGPNPIPFNKPGVTGRELPYLQQALASGHLSGNGAFTRRCHALLESLTGAPKVLLTTSCTHALEMAALLAGLEPGDEVVCPSFTFVSSVNAFALRGARPVFVDIRPDTLNIDERLLEAVITPRTRAIMVVHYAGVGCEMPALMAVAARHGLHVIEDNAHGLFGAYDGRALGSYGATSTLSFHETKNLTCGEGGALVINDPALVARAEILREKGTNRSRFFRGQVDKYTWVDVGSSYLPSDLLAAYLCAQLESWEEIQAARQSIWRRYDEALGSWTEAAGVVRPHVPAHCRHPAHMYYLLMPSLEDRTRFIAHLRARSVLAVFHYQALHLSDKGREYGGRAGQCPVTEDVVDRLVRLPLYFELAEADQARVIDAATSFRPGR
ncbi:MAG TPA: dTDP-4-amino-4,6-dideoxygalactose transaminase [Vicinamibacterales bacterium]|nr:dTDP-4-amino-4,6-dideoxygalactose transaminase [Vicinamibacterales bacterium]